MKNDFRPTVSSRTVFTLAGIALAAVSLVGDPALADNPQVNVDFFRPSVHPGDILDIQTATMPKQWEWGAGAWLTYNHRPMKLIGGDPYDMVRHQLVMDLFAHVALLDWLDVGVDLPFFLWSGGDGVPNGVRQNYPYLDEVSGVSLGDLRLAIKARILGGNGRGFGLGVGEDLTFPTSVAISGAAHKFDGEGNVTSTTNIIADYSRDGWIVALNVGVRVREAENIVGHQIGHQLLFGAGLQAPIICGVLEAIGTIENRTSLTHPYANEFDNGLDLMGGLRGYIGGVALTAAAGGNILQGYGSPAVRATVSVAWTPQLCKGCVHDRDRDGVPDADDACPDEAGEALAGGCPDRDRDGIPDDSDECPDTKGRIEARGCPDRDNDGIVDSRDKCPDKEGLIRFNGCPDTDEDGLPDFRDKCPQQEGPLERDGCPVKDRDGDGVMDEDDRCPDVAGDALHQGCPPPRVEVTAKRIVINEKVHFKTGKAQIMSDSFPLLKEIAEVIKANKQIRRIRVEGHTDSQGSASLNKRLSLKRARAVRKFLIGHGVAASRLTARGYGSSKPVADNSTKEGRSKNRRVEFTIVGR
ncbi:MAG: OmpA family protein [Deltaproteobacteria bacterium]|nr:OmpA family protein [Deltaproteobacteria bacterium]